MKLDSIWSAADLIKTGLAYTVMGILVVFLILVIIKYTSNKLKSGLTSQSLRDSSSIIMVYASKLRENRFVKFISFDDSKHPCHNFCS